MQKEPNGLLTLFPFCYISFSWLLCRLNEPKQLLQNWKQFSVEGKSTRGLVLGSEFVAFRNSLQEAIGVTSNHRSTISYHTDLFAQQQRKEKTIQLDNINHQGHNIGHSVQRRSTLQAGIKENWLAIVFQAFFYPKMHCLLDPFLKLFHHTLITLSLDVFLS